MNSTILKIINTQFPTLFDIELQREIASLGTIKSVKEGDLIMNINSYIKSVPLLVKGRIKVIREDSDSNELLMYYLNSGETCAMSLTCCLQNKKSEIKAIAEDSCEIISIPVEYMEKWMLKYVSWKNFVMQSYQVRFDELLQTIDSIAFMKMDQRLLKYLNDKFKLQKKNSIHITHQDIAYELNTSREVISRLLKKMEQDGLLTLSRNKIEIIT